MSVVGGRVVDQTRIRKEPGKNYLAIYSNREVVRMFDETKGEIEATTVPEFMDIKLTDECNGNCPYCYQNSGKYGLHADDPIKKLEEYFKGVLTEQLPLQVALGGGDPLLHPMFADICEWFAVRGVVPNLTTNGLNFNAGNLAVINTFCGGVAITAHRHLDAEWRSGFEKLSQYCETPALHVLFSDQESIDYIASIVDEYHDKAYAIVMLPFINQGRAAGSGVTPDYEAVDRLVMSLPDEKLAKLAWGALAYDFIKDHPRLKRSLSLYEPEQFSRYLDLVTMKEYPSSFAVTELQEMEG